MSSTYLFRKSHPVRTYSGKVKKNYRDYKSDLAADFKNRCGYTDCSDRWFGGKSSFHIDHFIPWKHNPNKLKTDYANLVYSCSYVNILKSNDQGNYLDPCQVDFNQHFFRSTSGEIHPHPDSKQAVYMHQRLKLNTKRYQIIWMLDQLYAAMEELSAIIELNENDENIVNLKIKHSDITREFQKYFNYLCG